MATGNIDCTISDRVCSLQPLNLNLFNNPDTSDCNNVQSFMSMHSNMTSNINTASFKDSESIQEFTNQLLSECARQSSIDDNKNFETKQSTQSPKRGSKNYNSAIMDNNKNSFCQGHDSYAIFKEQNVMPRALSIDVESDDEGVHSWRPNISSNALCSDFFVTPTILCEDLNLNFPNPLLNEIGDLNEVEGSSTNCTSQMIHSPLVLSPNASYGYPLNEATNYSKMDMSSLLRSQVAGLNNVKYETINARRRIDELKQDIQILTRKFNDKLTVQRTLDVERLREENAQLRLECQCLCMEVDYYLKGKAPLGEIDETFYQGNSQPQINTSTSQDQAEASSQGTPSHNSDDPDDSKKWECHACTFANHPAINSCEMCQTSRFHRNLQHFHSDSNDSCFCHPKTNSS